MSFLKHKIYAVLIIAAVLAIGITGGTAWSKYQIGKLEQAVEAAKIEADKLKQSAVKLEHKTAEYLQKIAYLEKHLTEIQEIAGKQDEELEKISRETNNSRNGVRHARTVRAIQSTAAELCSKLAQIGHACD
ncbi:MAG: hypothetical protein ACR2M8_08095 [Pyrinomonadaceae bacterium]